MKEWFRRPSKSKKEAKKEIFALEREIFQQKEFRRLLLNVSPKVQNFLVDIIRFTARALPDPTNNEAYVPEHHLLYNNKYCIVMGDSEIEGLKQGNLESLKTTLDKFINDEEAEFTRQKSQLQPGEIGEIMWPSQKLGDLKELRDVLIEKLPDLNEEGTENISQKDIERTANLVGVTTEELITHLGLTPENKIKIIE
jgi:hypothetical protein